MQRPTVPGPAAMQLSHPRLGVFGAAGTLPVAATGFVGAVRTKTAGRTGAVLAVQMPLRAPQPGGVQAEAISQRLNPPSPLPVAALDSDSDFTGTQIK